VPARAVICNDVTDVDRLFALTGYLIPDSALGVHCKELAGRGDATGFGCALGDHGAGLALTAHSVVDQELNCVGNLPRPVRGRRAR
jgi:hypothetical protein